MVDTMTKIPGVPTRDDVRPGVAFFANTGPFSTTCGECEHRGYYRAGREHFDAKSGQWVQSHRKVQACAVAHKISGRHGPDVKAEWPSCKYFEARK